ncbi:MAG: hypothetical protein H0V59_00410 [Nocardioidaceae bacterium]|nr:hypothetical protein [Nocardioidaceae bacterium]
MTRAAIYRALSTLGELEMVTLPLVGRFERDFDFRLEPLHAALLGTCADCRATGPAPGDAAPGRHQHT